MTDLVVQGIDATLVISTSAPTQLVAALDPPLVLVVAPLAATLNVTVAQAGVLTAPAAQGPVGPPGKDGPAGPVGPSGGNTTYTFVFPPTTVWFIAHNLGRFPSITTLETSGDQVIGDIAYLDANTLQVTFTVPVPGTAYLN